MYIYLSTVLRAHASGCSIIVYCVCILLNTDNTRGVTCHLTDVLFKLTCVYTCIGSGTCLMIYLVFWLLSYACMLCSYIRFSSLLCVNQATL